MENRQAAGIRQADARCLDTTREAPILQRFPPPNPVTGARVIPRRTVPLALAAVLAACQVERTPQEYFDHTVPIEAERAAAAEELDARIRAFGLAVDRGDAGAAHDALAPAGEVRLVGPVEGEVRLGAGEMDVMIEWLGADPGAALVVDAVDVEVGPRATVAWFAARLRVAAQGAGEAAGWHLSGVYTRQEGAWQLVQAHLSPVLTLQAPYPRPGAAPAAGAAAGSPAASPQGAP